MVANMVFVSLVAESTVFALNVVVQAVSMSEVFSKAVVALLTVLAVKVVVNVSAEDVS